MMMNPSFYQTVHQDRNSKAVNSRIAVFRFMKRHAFRLFITAIIAVILFSSFLMFSINAASEHPAAAGPDEAVVIVSSGDTLWEIARQYTNGKGDIRKSVFLIKKRNGLATSDLHPGQSLIIPEL